MTHPFRSLSGRDFEFVVYRQNWGEDRVHLRDESGQLFSVLCTVIQDEDGGVIRGEHVRA